MQIAVAGVEDVADDQVVFLRDIADVSQHRGNLAARHHAILRVVRRADAPQRRESHLAALPQQRALFFVLGAPHLARLLLQADFPHRFRLLFHRLAQSFQLDQQHRARIQRIAGVAERFDGAQASSHPASPAPPE